MSEQITKADLEELYEKHWFRLEGIERPDSNHFVEIVFTCEGEIGENIQFQWGMMNAANLNQDMKDDWREIIKNEGLTIHSEDSNYITTFDEELDDPEVLADLTVRMLDEVYGCGLSEVVEIRERDL